MTLTSILLVANLVVALALVVVVQYLWSLLKSASLVIAYIAYYLNDKYEDFGKKQFKEMDE